MAAGSGGALGTSIVTPPGGMGWGGGDMNPDNMLNDFMSMFKFGMNYQFMAPMMQGMMRTMGLGSSGIGGLGDPRVEELFKKMEQQEKVTEALQRQIDALQKKEDPASQVMKKPCPNRT
jgi:hypothetical protein